MNLYSTELSMEQVISNRRFQLPMIASLCPMNRKRFHPMLSFQSSQLIVGPQRHFVRLKHRRLKCLLNARDAHTHMHTLYTQGHPGTDESFVSNLSPLCLCVCVCASGTRIFSCQLLCALYHLLESGKEKNANTILSLI